MHETRIAANWLKVISPALSHCRQIFKWSEKKGEYRGKRTIQRNWTWINTCHSSLFQFVCPQYLNYVHSKYTIELENKAIVCPICSWNLIMWHMSIRWWHAQPISSIKIIFTPNISTNMLLSYLNRTTFIAKGSRQKMNQCFFKRVRVLFTKYSTCYVFFISVQFFLAEPIKSVHIVQSSISRPHRTNQKVTITLNFFSFISIWDESVFTWLSHECLE